MQAVWLEAFIYIKHVGWEDSRHVKLVPTASVLHESIVMATDNTDGFCEVTCCFNEGEDESSWLRVDTPSLVSPEHAGTFRRTDSIDWQYWSHWLTVSVKV